MMELVKNVDGNEVLAHLTLNVPDYYANQTQRDCVVDTTWRVIAYEGERGI
jgi:hypothetical protein